MKLLRLILLPVILLLSGCLIRPISEWPSPDEPCPGFISQYHYINKYIEIEAQNDESSITVRFYTIADDLETTATKVWWKNDDIYQMMKEKYGDDQTWTYGSVSPYDHAFVESINAISIKSTPAWSEDYSATSSLNDIFEVEYATYKYFVESGFDEDFGGMRRWRTERKRVSELQEDDMWFIRTDFSLICTTPPGDERERYLKVTLSLDTGEEIMYRVKVN